MKALFLAVSAEGGVPCAGLTSLFHAGNFPLLVLDVVALLFYEGHYALVACSERGVV